ncbi:ArsR family transcriptional regulator [Bacillus infantis]|uniref:DNA topoisomerase (ATP-hydrolyzing) n=1 Tax=Bacillus infantis TaxID=324767 RepID=A0A5D4QWR0_9BACI|nr:ArsR family transcriptional regulator [Bacillus infantis]TYS41898.1 ArsR family transcriptional regulator [Bacillus infantis]
MPFKEELNLIKQQLEILIKKADSIDAVSLIQESEEESLSTSISYSGTITTDEGRRKWKPASKTLGEVLAPDSGGLANILSSLGHKQRIEIIKSLLQEPKNAAELVRELEMGTTGQLYHHMKPLLHAGIIEQKERGGSYSITADKILPILLQLAAAAEMFESSRYLTLEALREEPEKMNIRTEGEFDADILLLSLIHHSVQEHEAGHASRINIYLHSDGSATVSDDGRGIPVSLLEGTSMSRLQDVLTDVEKNYLEDSSNEKTGIPVAAINAFSEKLTVLIKKDHQIYRQEYQYGKALTQVVPIGETNETGTSISFLPDKKVFKTGFHSEKLEEKLNELQRCYPDLSLSLQ